MEKCGDINPDRTPKETPCKEADLETLADNPVTRLVDAAQKSACCRKTPCTSVNVNEA